MLHVLYISNKIFLGEKVLKRSLNVSMCRFIFVIYNIKQE